MKDIIAKTETMVRETLGGAEGGHDWLHTDRVRNTALVIAQHEGNCDLLVVELAALLHDIADAKFNGGDEEQGPQIAEDFLRQEGLDENRIGIATNIIRFVSFRKKDDPDLRMSPELAAVTDADRLDAMGAIGIGRAFNYGGFKNRPMYDPEIAPEMDPQKYSSSASPTINHFHEKLLLLKGLMLTSKGREMAEHRHEFMRQYLEQFYFEVRSAK